MMDRARQDFRDAARTLWRNPRWTAVAALTLALGIGGNSAIFAFVDGFVLKPFAYPEPSRLVAIGAAFPRESAPARYIEVLSPPEFVDIRQSRAIQQIAAFDAGNRSISGGDRPERVFTLLALTDLFPTFGLRPLHGRGFTADELAPNGPRAAVLSYRLWQGRFGGDPSIVGRTLRINGQPTTVVGIMPRELVVLGADLWIPWRSDPAAVPRSARLLTLVGRLAPGTSLDEANAELAAIANRVARDHGAEFREYGEWRLSARPWADVVTGEFRMAGLLVLGAVGLVLLIACANIANLLLARAAHRQREIAIRLTLGASSLAIARQLLAETILLSAVGGVLGLVLAQVALRAAVDLVPSRMESLGIAATLSVRVLAWTALVSVGAAVVVALMPLLHAWRIAPGNALKADGRNATIARAPQRLRATLVVAEIALALMLLVGASLLLLSFNRLRQVDTGISAPDVLTMRLTLPTEKYRGVAFNVFFQEVINRLERLAGVRSVSAASQLPLSAFVGTRFRIVGDGVTTKTIPTAWVTVASDRHLATFGIPIVSGRSLDDRDRGDGQPVALVNQAFVRRFVGSRNPLVQRLDLGTADAPRVVQIVGVFGDAHNRGIAQPPEPELIVPMHQQTDWNQLFVSVRTEGDATAVLPAVRRTIAELDVDQPIYAVQTLRDALADNSFQQRVSMILLGLFACIAVSLAAIGVYGVMSFAVSARTAEIGIRMAMGARRTQVIRLVLGQVARLTICGIAIGTLLALAVAPMLGQLLFNVQPADPMTLVVVPFVLGAVALFAGWWPARRASLIQPMEAIRGA